VADRSKQRIGYIDWMRGLACVAMFQTHCYDSWLGAQARHGRFFRWSQLGGTLPAPLFLFLAGFSFALVADRMRRKGVAVAGISRRTIRHGAEILGLALLFRLQEFLLGQPSAPWADLLRVDILNIIGVSLMLLGVLYWLAALGAAPAGAELSGLPMSAGRRARFAGFAALGAAAVAMATPPLWTTYQPRWLPWFLESYINGVHTFGKPQPWLFPLFPWAGFALAGMAVGFVLLSPWARRHELAAVSATGAAGALLCGVGLWLDAQPGHLYAVYDFWHTSPNFFLMRVGVLMGIILASYAWCRWGAGQAAFHPVIELGQASLLVYWVHIEFVYGGLSFLTKHVQGIPAATLGLVVIFSSMTLLAVARNRTRGRGLRALAFWRQPAGVSAERA
jgi:acyltransferase